MYSPSDIVDGVLTNPEQIWGTLDSFWRTKVVVSDADLIKFQTFASLVLAANTYDRSQHFIKAQGIATLEAFAQVPWYPIIVYRNQLVDLNYVLFDGSHDYDDPPEIVFGEEADPSYQLPVLPKFAEITSLYDGITNTSIVLDGAAFSYNAADQTITFQEDPFTQVYVRSTSSGAEYLILWARNPKLDLNVPFDWTGWTLQLKGSSSAEYVRALQETWRLVVGGSNSGSMKSGLSISRGLPVATVAGTVTDILDDGFHTIVVVNQSAHLAPNAASAVVAIGDTVTAGQLLFDGVQVFSGLELLATTEATVPGIAFYVPAADGSILSLFAPNQTLAWSYDAMRTSPWRFPIGGTVADVETYWTERNVDLSVYYPGLVDGDPVNPMQLLVEDLWKNAITVAAVDLGIGTNAVPGFIDRAALSLSPSTYLIVQQKIADVTGDVVDASSGSESVGYGYHTSDPSDTISTIGTDLIISDYTPIVTVS